MLRLILILPILIQISCKSNGQAEMNKIIYIGDPMCSWCYGVSDNLAKLVNANQDKNEIEIVLGGLRPGGGDEWNANFTNFLDQHWKEVNHKSGVPFNHTLLKSEYFNYDTEPACRAVVVVRDMDAKITLDFFKAIQKEFYVMNKDPKTMGFYKPLLQKFNLDIDVFASKFQSQEYKLKTQKDFNRSAQLGVRSFPTVLFQKGDNVTPIANGYATFEQMQSKIDELGR